VLLASARGVGCGEKTKADCAFEGKKGVKGWQRILRKNNLEQLVEETMEGATGPKKKWQEVVAAKPV
jgi:hypothetical protein